MSLLNQITRFLRLVRRSMAKAISAIDVITGGPRKQNRVREWFFSTSGGLTAGVALIYTSNILPNETRLKKVHVSVQPRMRVNDCNVLINVFMTQSEAPTGAEVNEAESVIKWYQVGVPGVFVINGEAQSFDFEINKRITGALWRIGIMFRGFSANMDIGRAGVLYELP